MRIREFACVILTFIVQINAQSGCNTLRISGTSVAHHISGRYQIVPSNQLCSGRQVYQQEGGNNYLYYNSDSEADAWLVGDDLCSEEAFLMVLGTATNPESITATWDEVNEWSIWTSNAMIKVTCDTGGFEGCHELQVTNARYNPVVEGRYQVLLQCPLCYGRYTYKHVSKDLYLYSTGYWYIDSVNCCDDPKQQVFAQFLDGAFYPEDITGTGQEPRVNGKVQVPTGLTVQCSGSPRQKRGTFTWETPELAALCSGVEAVTGLLGLTAIAAALSYSLEY